MDSPLELSTAQRFELERLGRAIDNTSDPKVLRQIAKQLLQAWQSQKAATRWVMSQQLGAPPRVSPGVVEAKLAEARAAAEQIEALERLAQQSPRDDDPEGLAAT